MAKIDQELIERLKKKLGVGQTAVYARIKKTAREHWLPRRDLAALRLGWENGITIQISQRRQNALSRPALLNKSPS